MERTELTIPQTWAELSVSLPFSCELRIDVDVIVRTIKETPKSWLQLALDFYPNLISFSHSRQALSAA